jgi:cell wall-associated NlpC family hydrolase
MQVFAQFGVQLKHNAQLQYNAVPHIHDAQLQPGDLVFFQICCQPPDVITHVGIYVGGGQMIHAPTEGQVVRVESITTPYWRSHWAGAGRVVLPRGGSP